jgi:D-arabinose 5-phosphate isomerase GutQ
LREAVTALAATTLRAMNMRAGSVDVILLKNKDASQDELMVLEVNGGIMAEGLTKSGEIGRAMAARTYERLLDCAFKFQAL